MEISAIRAKLTDAIQLLDQAPHDVDEVTYGTLRLVRERVSRSVQTLDRLRHRLEEEPDGG